MKTRFVRIVCLVCAVGLAVGLATGCKSPEEEDAEMAISEALAEKQAKESLDKSRAEQKADEGKAAEGEVMQYEADESDAFTGGWSMHGLERVLQNKKEWGAGKLGPSGDMNTMTIVKQGGKYSVQGAPFYTVTVAGQNVTIKGTSPAVEAGGLRGDGIYSEYSGVLEGDTIVGTRHHAVASERLVWDGEWRATRVQ